MIKIFQNFVIFTPRELTYLLWWQWRCWMLTTHQVWVKITMFGLVSDILGPVQTAAANSIQEVVWSSLSSLIINHENKYFHLHDNLHLYGDILIVAMYVFLNLLFILSYVSCCIIECTKDPTMMVLHHICQVLYFYILCQLRYTSDYHYTISLLVYALQRELELEEVWA